ncbi:TsaA-like domain-containing protein [Pavlovales sp. CCMP2436]|nr:TsaA-like domain-containing protein [Pavlovales sp. CCMP2436]|mmetsp:Transcript_44883/g.111244  ORF Transcript_44883/g.111244 Transcript_44883/m.111244 type:complete len:307 (-) Transcript_44883:100-1020(-)
MLKARAGLRGLSVASHALSALALQQVRSTPIGYIETVFPTKFVTPRQGSYSACTRARLKITGLPGANVQARDTLAGLEAFSHVWLLFSFHMVGSQPLKPKIKLPRLGGRKLGVFATRSPHRPNPIGLSLVRLDSVGNDFVELSGVDLCDGTPILDIKPYIPVYDCPEEGQVRVPDWIEGAGAPLCTVSFTLAAVDQASELQSHLRLLRGAEELLAAVEDVLGADPRPAYRRQNESGQYDFDIDVMRVYSVFQLVGRSAVEGEDGGILNYGHFTVSKVELRDLSFVPLRQKKIADAGLSLADDSAPP